MREKVYGPVKLHTAVREKVYGPVELDTAVIEKVYGPVELHPGYRTSCLNYQSFGLNYNSS